MTTDKDFFRKAKETEEMAGWTTSASIGQAISCLFRVKSDDPVFNFRKFAFPSLIRTLWFLLSWGLFICSVGACIWLPLLAIDRGHKIYDLNLSDEKSLKQKFAREAYEQAYSVVSNDRSGGDFLAGERLDDPTLLQFKNAALRNREVFDVLMSNSQGIKSFAGTASYDITEEFESNVKAIKIGQEARTMVKFDSQNSKQTWIAVILKEGPSIPKAVNPTSTLLAEALIADAGIIAGLVLSLLLIRLVCETAILFFRFVDEVVAIHGTIKGKEEASVVSEPKGGQYEPQN